ncbi:MAG: Unknown protein [uncultured Thiotrichaceae bacterium]|uniref:DUF937 domain-containing protein n=1 Tax=uncultured Thiotrichaceae bacterium TaxID=298394 RepID=A0A6S6UJN7_9GAMM|nr:MAG: Unknown protein [uncultured Thiotrichaceae bacterium]
MSFNILDTMKDHLSDQVMTRIGDVIGSDAGQTTNALSGALPGLFDRFADAGNNESAAEALFAAVKDQDDTILDSLGDFLAGDNASRVANSGSSLLSSLLGNNNLSNLADTVSRLSGLGAGSSSSLLGMLAPLALGVIKRKLLSDDAFDLSSMTSMLTGQKQNIQAALPQRFIQDNGEPLDVETTELNKVEPVTVTDKVTHQHETLEDNSASLFAKLIPWLMLLAGIIVLYFLFSGKSDGEKVVEKQTSTSEIIERSATTAPENTQPLINDNPVAPEKPEESGQSDTKSMMEQAIPAAGKINITNELRNNLSNITQGLSGIRDIESAKATIPAIDAANSKIGEMTGMLDSMPAPAKGAIGKLISSALPQLQMLSDKANNIPGVGEIINPALNALSENLQKFQ